MVDNIQEIINQVEEIRRDAERDLEILVYSNGWLRGVQYGTVHQQS